MPINLTYGIYLFILPPKSGLRLLSYCCKRLLSRNVTFCTVWTLRVDFILAEMVVGRNDFIEAPIDSFPCGGATDHFLCEFWLSFTKALLAFDRRLFWDFGMTAIPRLILHKIERLSVTWVIRMSILFCFFSC